MITNEYYNALHALQQPQQFRNFLLENFCMHYLSFSSIFQILFVILVLWISLKVRNIPIMMIGKLYLMKCNRLSGFFVFLMIVMLGLSLYCHHKFDVQQLQNVAA